MCHNCSWVNVTWTALCFPASYMVAVPVWSWGCKKMWLRNVWLYFFLYVCYVALKKKHTSVAEGETERLHPHFLPRTCVRVTKFSTFLLWFVLTSSILLRPVLVKAQKTHFPCASQRQQNSGQTGPTSLVLNTLTRPQFESFVFVCLKWGDADGCQGLFFSLWSLNIFPQTARRLFFHFKLKAYTFCKNNTPL